MVNIVKDELGPGTRHWPWSSKKVGGYRRVGAGAGRRGRRRRRPSSGGKLSAGHASILGEPTAVEPSFLGGCRHSQHSVWLAGGLHSPASRRRLALGSPPRHQRTSDYPPSRGRRDAQRDVRHRRPPAGSSRISRNAGCPPRLGGNHYPPEVASVQAPVQQQLT